MVNVNASDAFKIVNDIREKAVKLKIKYLNKILSFTVRGGVADSHRAKSFNDLFRLVDKALYKAKKQGKNKIVGLSVGV